MEVARAQSTATAARAPTRLRLRPRERSSHLLRAVRQRHTHLRTPDDIDEAVKVMERLHLLYGGKDFARTGHGPGRPSDSYSPVTSFKAIPHLNTTLLQFICVVVEHRGKGKCTY